MAASMPMPCALSPGSAAAGATGGKTAPRSASRARDQASTRCAAAASADVGSCIDMIAILQAVAAHPKAAAGGRNALLPSGRQAAMVPTIRLHDLWHTQAALALQVPMVVTLPYWGPKH